MTRPTTPRQIQLLQQVAERDPANGAAWLSMAALLPRGSAERAAALQRAAQAPHIRFYEQDILRLQHQALVREPGGAEVAPPSADRSTQILMMSTTIAWLYADNVRQLCPVPDRSAAANPGSAEFAQCQRVLELVATDEANNLVRRTLATALLLERTPASEPTQITHLREYLRNLYWLLRHLGAGQAAHMHSGHFMLSNEAEHTRLHLQTSGQPVQAPPGWLPDSARARALLGQPLQNAVAPASAAPASR